MICLFTPTITDIRVHRGLSVAHVIVDPRLSECHVVIKISVISCVIVAALGTASLAEPRPSCPTGFHTLYSQNAMTLDSAMQRPIRVPSPDGQKMVQVSVVMDDPKTPDGWRMDLTVKSGGKIFKTSLLGFNGELAWSPDSKAFAVTLTTGGGSLGS